MTDRAAVDPSIMAGLAQIIAAGVDRRLTEVEMVLAAMTKRERQLVREVAVMAHVRARPYSGPPPPPDAEVLSATISACLAMPDLYPTLTRLLRAATRRAAANATGLPARRVSVPQ